MYSFENGGTISFHQEEIYHTHYDNLSHTLGSTAGIVLTHIYYIRIKFIKGLHILDLVVTETLKMQPS